MIDILFTEMFWWFFGTAVAFTLFGRYMALKSYVVDAVTATIDSLIEDGYLKTRGTGANMVILKHTEWCKKDVDI